MIGKKCLLSLNMILLRCIHFVLRGAITCDKFVYQRMNEIEGRLAPQKKIEIRPEQDYKDALFDRINLITHAGGGLDGLSYLNCREAYPIYRDGGNTTTEYDVAEINGNYVLAHQGDGQSKLDERFTPLTLEECLENLILDTDSIVIFDCKFRDLTDFCNTIARQIPVETRNRVVIQVFCEDNIRQVREAGLSHMLYVCMMDSDYVEAANLCMLHGIGAVSISDKAIRERTGWEVFGQCKIRTYVYTVNEIRRLRELRVMGLTGIFSDFLKQKEIDKVMPI